MLTIGKQSCPLRLNGKVLGGIGLCLIFIGRVPDSCRLICALSLVQGGVPRLAAFLVKSVLSYWSNLAVFVEGISALDRSFWSTAGSLSAQDSWLAEGSSSAALLLLVGGSA